MQTEKSLDNIIRYLYNEVNDVEAQQIEHQISMSQELEETVLDFGAILSDLDKAFKRPSDTCIQKILSFSKTKASANI